MPIANAPIKVNMPMILPVIDSGLSPQDRLSRQDTQTGALMALDLR